MVELRKNGTKLNISLTEFQNLPQLHSIIVPFKPKLLKNNISNHHRILMFAPLQQNLIDSLMTHTIIDMRFENDLKVVDDALYEHEIFHFLVHE